MNRFRCRLRVLQARAAVRRYLRPDLVQPPTGEGPDLRLPAIGLALLVYLAINGLWWLLTT